MGRGKELLIDEWFYFHFADEDKMESVYELFDKILVVCDKILIQRGSPIAQKLFLLFEQASFYPPKNKDVIKKFGKKFLYNLDKIIFFEQDFTIDIDETVEAELHKNDIYLVKMCYQSKDKIFVTTDNRLAEPMNKHKEYLGITVYMADDFMNLYPNI